jgi:hypoxanthine-DNA glycosylase
VLILGSFPSRRSLETGQYYANPNNQFWQVIENLLQVPCTLPYEERITILTDRHIALWDSIGSCIREGSADSRIRMPLLNPLGSFLAANPSLRLVACNGSAAAMYAGQAIPDGTVTIIRLPSTSPAYARLSVSEKTGRWSILLDYR